MPETTCTKCLRPSCKGDCKHHRRCLTPKWTGQGRVQKARIKRSGKSGVLAVGCDRIGQVIQNRMLGRSRVKQSEKTATINADGRGFAIRISYQGSTLEMIHVLTLEKAVRKAAKYGTANVSEQGLLTALIVNFIAQNMGITKAFRRA